MRYKPRSEAIFWPIHFRLVQQSVQQHRTTAAHVGTEAFTPARPGSGPSHARLGTVRRCSWLGRLTLEAAVSGDHGPHPLGWPLRSVAGLLSSRRAAPVTSSSGRCWVAALQVARDGRLKGGVRIHDWLVADLAAWRDHPLVSAPHRIDRVPATQQWPGPLHERTTLQYRTRSKSSSVLPQTRSRSQSRSQLSRNCVRTREASNDCWADSSWLDERCGLSLIVDDGSFRRRQNKRGKPTIEGRLGYLGPLGMPTPPKVKLDLTADEVIVRRLDPRPVMHPFSDAPSSPAAGHLAHVVCYSLPELLGEKIRALAERCRPRDLYDVVHTHRHPDLIGRANDVMSSMPRLCALSMAEATAWDAAVSPRSFSDCWASLRLSRLTSEVPKSAARSTTRRRWPTSMTVDSIPASDASPVADGASLARIAWLEPFRRASRHHRRSHSGYGADADVGAAVGGLDFDACADALSQFADVADEADGAAAFA